MKRGVFDPAADSPSDRAANGAAFPKLFRARLPVRFQCKGRRPALQASTKSLGKEISLSVRMGDRSREDAALRPRLAGGRVRRPCSTPSWRRPFDVS